MFKRLFFVFLLFCALDCAAFARGKKANTSDTKANEKVSMKWNDIAVTTFGSNADLPDGVPDFEHNGGLVNMPILLGIHSFRGLVYGFSRMVQLLCMLFCFFGIIFSVFKMWAGTMETKKMTVNTLYNCLLCFLAFWCYVPLTDWVFSQATRLGMTAGGGYTTLNVVYTRTVMEYENEISNIMPEIVDIIIKDAAVNVNGKRYVSYEALKTFQDKAKIPNIEDYAKSMGVELFYSVERLDKRYTGVSSNSSDHDAFSKDDNYTYVPTIHYVDSNGKELPQGGSASWLENLINGNINRFDQVRDRINKKIGETDYSALTVKYNALMEVMSDVTTNELRVKDNYTLGLVKDHAMEPVRELKYAPFLRDKNNQVTDFLAPSLIIKTVSLMSDVLAITNSSTTDENGENEKIKFNPGGVWTYKGLQKTISTLLYYWVSHIIVLISMLEYTVTLIEFYIVRGISTLLIPLLFLDATKSYASNLIRLLVSYFFKIMVVMFCCFFALANTLNTLLALYSGVDMMSNTTTLLYYLFSLILGASLVMSAGKIAGAAMSGNPAIGAGDIAATVRNGIHTAHAMQHLAQGAGSAMFGRVGADGKRHGGLLPTANNIGKGTVNAGRNLSGLASGASAARQNAMKQLDEKRSLGAFSNLSDKEFSKLKNSAGSSAEWGTVGQKMKQSIGDGLFKLATGQERQHLDDQGKNTGFFNVGDKVLVDENDPTKGTRAATTADVAKRAKEKGERSTDNAVRNVQNFINSGKKSGKEQTEEYEKRTGQHPPKAQSEM